MSTSQRRAVVLATLLVTSVVAGAVAFTGTTAAQADSDAPSIVSAVEYDGNVEVVFSDEVRDAADQSALDGQTFDVEVDGTTYDATVRTDANPRYVLSGDWGDLNPTQDVTLTASDVQANDTDGQSVDRIAESVDVTSVVLDSAETAHSSRSAADSVFAGEVIAVRSQTGDNYEIRDLTDSNAIQGGSLGESMSTFAFDTEHLDTGNSYRISFTDGANDKFFNVTDLGLSASADDVNTQEDLEVDVEATWGNRPVTAELVGEDETRETTLDGQGEATVDFGQIDAGNYTVSVTDDRSGIETTTGTIEVVPAGDVDANFGEDAFVDDEVGDVAEIPIYLENTDTADVRIGSTDEEYWINATVEDEGDGRVNLLFDTATAGTHGTNEVLTVYTEAESDDVVVHEEGGTVSENDDATLGAGNHELFVDTGVGDDIGTLHLTETDDADANFGSDAFVTAEVGTVAEIPIELENTDTVEVQIGSEDDGYWINGTVEDAGDGTVTLLFDSGAAGTDDVLTVATDAENDSVSDVREGGDLVANGTGAALDAGEYPMSVTTASGDDIGTLSLQPSGEDELEPLPNRSAPTDPDDDGLYEDVDGDGATDLADVVALFQHREEPAVTDSVAAYDFSGNDEIDLADVVSLFGEVTAD